MDRHIRQIRSVASEFNTREDGEALSIEGYFAVFNSTYIIAPGYSESVESGAFTETISDDIRALINHDTSMVLGRTKAGYEFGCTRSRRRLEDESEFIPYATGEL